MAAVLLVAGLLIGGCNGYRSGVSLERRAACKAGVAEWVVVGDGGEVEFRYKTKAE
ncbi:MAG TPA: hypothetical protein VD932_02455 [Aquabacterium sp.]|nr:hypothetical protein [Aquabacterium sp.]